jgi:N-methylhydantoinase A
VDERIDHTGQVLTLSIRPGRYPASTPAAANIESIAVCLLFSFLHPNHEQLITAKLRSAGFLVSTSCEILPEFREYERTSTTVINAYVSPILDRYLSRLETALTTPSGAQPPSEEAASLRIMLNGGAISLAEARLAVRAASLPVGRRHHWRPPCGAVSPGSVRLITFDMGGTYGCFSHRRRTASPAKPRSAACLFVSPFSISPSARAAVPCLLPGALRVGPEAGADPGAACYSPDPPALHPSGHFRRHRLTWSRRLPPDLFLGALCH